MQKKVYFCSTFRIMTSKILLIDGDISLSTVLSDYLASRGYKTRVADTGRAGLECLASEHYDLVLTELQGIGMNGYELLKDIRHRLPQIPLIVLTTRSDREDQMRAFQLGADDYQTKPFTMDILICRIEAILRRVRAFDLLLMLCRHEGEVVDKHKILSALWKEDNAFTARSLGVYINHLRGYVTAAEYEIIAVRYKGYKLVNKI